jgi:hypothetical protein
MFQTATSLSAWPYGSGFSKIALRTLNMIVASAMPPPSMPTRLAVRPGWLITPRMA